MKNPKNSSDPLVGKEFYTVIYNDIIKIIKLLFRKMKLLFKTSGRINRITYFEMEFFSSLIFPYGIPILGSIVFDTDIFSTIGVLLFLIALVCLSIRRLHDLDLSGWYVSIALLFLLVYIPIESFLGEGFIIFIISLLNLAAMYLLLKKGTPGKNQYGKEPRKGFHL